MPNYDRQFISMKRSERLSKLTKYNIFLVIFFPAYIAGAFWYYVKSVFDVAYWRENSRWR